MIELRDVSKVFRMGSERVEALKGINLKIEPGEVCCIVGTSGSGKSTLLNMIAGLEKPSKGQIIIKNYHIEKMNEIQVTNFRKKFIGFIFQSYNLLPTLSALDNVALPLVFAGISLKARRKLATEMLDAVGLGDRLGHRPNQMSGGQQQRVCIARALVNSPQIIFADEPTGNLDTSTTDEIMKLMIHLTRSKNRTLVIVTHDIETSVYADRMIHMRDGQISHVEHISNSNLVRR